MGLYSDFIHLAEVEKTKLRLLERKPHALINFLQKTAQHDI